MFSLIIAIVSIALIVALIALGGYFGGDAITDAQAKTQAIRLVNEETQILAAMEMFQAENKRYPASVNELVSTGFLRSIPQGVNLPSVAAAASFEFVSSAHAESVDVSGLGWGMPQAGTPVISTSPKVPLVVCKAYNKVSRGDDGILRQPFESLPAQCYGADGNYRIVVRKPAVVLGGVLDSSVEQGGLPTKGMDGWWDSPPTSDVKLPTDPDKTPKPQLVMSGAESSLAFGQVQLGQQAKSGMLVVSNRGQGPANAFKVQAPAGFGVSDSSCGTVLSAGASCSFAVTFAPGAAQTYGGSVTAAGDLGGAAQLRTYGEGVAGSYAFTGVDFGGQFAGAQVVRDVALSNTGIGPLQLGGPVVTGTGFSLSSGATCGTSLAAGASCVFKIALTPSGQTAHMGQISLPISDVGSISAILAGQSRETFNVDLTASASGTATIPASVTSVTLIGKGAPGGDDSKPGQPYIAPTAEQLEVKAQPAKAATYRWSYLTYYAERGPYDYGVPYDSCISIDPAVPQVAGMYGYCTFQMIGITGEYFYYSYTYISVLDQPAQAAVEGKPYIPASPGQPYIAPSGGPTYGAATVATVGGATRNFLGGYGASVQASPGTTTVGLPGGGAQTLSFTIPAGGALNYKYSYTLPY